MKAQRGGPGRGQGRKPVKQGEETVTVSLRMTIAQRAKLGDLGGAQWVRQRIDAAEHYTGDYTRHPDEIQQPPANA